MQNTMTKQDLQLTMADGQVLNFRFDMGTARVIKELTGVDPMKDSIPGDWWESAAAIFSAAYLRACKVYKTPPAYTYEDLKDLYEQLDINGALEFIRGFNAVMTVKITPETAAAIKEAEKEQEIEGPTEQAKRMEAEKIEENAPSTGSPNR